MYNDGRLSKHEDFLQNIQDSAYNFGRIHPTDDTLQAKTQPFVLPNNGEGEEEVTDEEEQHPYLQGAELDMFLNSFEIDLGTGESDQTTQTYD